MVLDLILLLRFQDAMAICREFGRPHLFVTFTASAKWKAISESIMENEKSIHRADIVVRVFQNYLKEFIHDLTKKNLFAQHFIKWKDKD